MIAKRLMILLSFLLLIAATVFYLLRVWPEQQSEELVIEAPPKEIPLEKRASPSGPNTSGTANPIGTDHPTEDAAENDTDEDDVELPPQVNTGTSDDGTPQNIPPPPQE